MFIRRKEENGAAMSSLGERVKEGFAGLRDLRRRRGGVVGWQGWLGMVNKVGHGLYGRYIDRHCYGTIRRRRGTREMSHPETSQHTVQ